MIIDLNGEKYGRLLVLERSKNKNKVTCLCDCGNNIDVYVRHIRNGHTKSCGCIRKEKLHGMSGTKEYKAWQGMIGRCEKPSKYHNYHLYGGRGIIVCDRWHDFKEFYADMGNCPINMSLDRIDNNGNYEPSNCRWASAKEQSNNKRTNTLIAFNGQTKTMKQWAEEFNIPYERLCQRIKRDRWPIERALSVGVV